MFCSEVLPQGPNHVASSEMWSHTARVRQERFCIPLTGKFWVRDLNVWAEGRQFHNNEEVEMAVRKMFSHLNKDGILHSCREI